MQLQTAVKRIFEVKIKEASSVQQDASFFSNHLQNWRWKLILLKRKKKVQLQTAVKRIFEVKIKEASSVQQDASFFRLNIPVLTFSNCFGVTATG